MSPTTFCYTFAAIYAAIRGTLSVHWLFDSAAMWAEAFRPFEDPDYWALLGPRFIGNRNLAIALPLLACILSGRPRLVALMLACGVIIDLPDAIELFIGTLKGYSGPGTDFYMYGAWGLTILLTVCSSHLFLEPERLRA